MSAHKALDSAAPQRAKFSTLYCVRSRDHECDEFECFFLTAADAEKTARLAGVGFYVDEVEVFPEAQRRVVMHWVQRFLSAYDLPDKSGSVEVWEFDAPRLLALDGYVAYGWTSSEALARLEENVRVARSVRPEGAES